MQTRPLILALSGGSGSGKTTLAEELAQELPDGFLSILSQDDYYKDLSHLSDEERGRVNFDHPRAIDGSLLAEHLRQLAGGSAIERPVYDFFSHSRLTRKVPVAPGNAVILDGIFSLCFPELMPVFDLRIFVDVSDDIRFIRRLLRDQKDRGRSLRGITDQYLNSVRKGHEEFVVKSRAAADIVVPWELRNKNIIKMLKGYILSSAAVSASARS